MEGLKQLRVHRGYSQRQLAARSGIDQGAISEIEAGKRSPSVVTLERLVRAMDAEMAELFPKAQAPLPFEEDEQKEWRSPFLEAWRSYLLRLAREWEYAPEEELDKEGDVFSDPGHRAAFLERHELAVTKCQEILGHFAEAVSQHRYLYDTGDLPAITPSQLAELREAHWAINKVSIKWQVIAQSIVKAASEEIEPDELARFRKNKETTEKAIEGFQNAMARYEERLSA